MVWDSALLAARASLHVPGGANTTLEWMHHSHRPAAASQHWNATGLLYGNVPMWPWHFATSLIQEWSCGPGRRDWCQVENAHILALTTFLIFALVLVSCIYIHIREDKEEQITPLCPQLIVKGNKPLQFRLDLDPDVDTTEVYNTENDELYCSIVTDSYDPLRPGFSGVAATVRLQDKMGHTIATIVARSVSVQGQGLCVCRAGCEIFGFAEAEEKREGRYYMRHRSDVHLLTLDGDWTSYGGNFKMMNPAGLTVFRMQKTGTLCEGEIHQGTDAGLMLCLLFAAHLNRQLQTKEFPSPWGPFAAFPPFSQSSQLPSQSSPLGSPHGSATTRVVDHPVAAGMSESSAATHHAEPVAATGGSTGRGSGKGGSRQPLAGDASNVTHVETEEP